MSTEGDNEALDLDHLKDLCAAALMARWGVDDCDADAYDAACADFDKIAPIIAAAVERLTAERDSARELVVRLEQDNAEALRIARVALDPTQAVVATPYRQINALRDIQRVLGAFPDDETGVQA